MNPIGSISFVIEGKPLTKENKQQFGKGQYYSKSNKEIREWEINVGKIAKQAMIDAKWEGPWLGRVGIFANMVFGDYGRKDITNYWKSLNDGLNGYVYYDDSQIDFAVACRQKNKENPRIEVTIYFFDYMYDINSAKRPNPYEMFSVNNVDFTQGVDIVYKHTRKYDSFVGKFKEDDIEVKPKTNNGYINSSNRKYKNGTTVSRKRPGTSKDSIKS